MPIANPLANGQINGQIADLYGQIGAVKMWRSRTFNSAGVTVTFNCDEKEDHGDDKADAVDKALVKVGGLGIGLPRTLKVYATGVTSVGNLQMKNVAFPRGISGAQDPSMVLSPKVLNYTWAAGLNGVCSQEGVYDGTAVGLCTAIVIHEIGHLLHEAEDDTSFWGAMPQFPNGVNPGSIFDAVSAYAATNTKELVAEVFLGRVYGKVYPPAIMTAYRTLGGPAQAILA